jgi:hypothetical protein
MFEHALHQFVGKLGGMQSDSVGIWTCACEGKMDQLVLAADAKGLHIFLGL